MNSVPEAEVRPPRLDRAPVKAANALIRGAKVIDPRAGIDGHHDLLIRGGEIAEIGAPGSLEAPDGAEVIDAEGLHAFPAFVDPHVHLRTPGREDEEDIDSGTRAAAAGGFCAILAMPNTDPVVDDVSVLRSLQDRARAEARVPVGFTAAITRGQHGEDLTEMWELAEGGAAAFTDDGLPVRSAGVMRQALQYQRLAGRVLALHEEDPALSRKGVMHEGVVSAVLGLTGIPSVSESTMVQRDCALARYEGGRIHIQHLSARESVEAIAVAKEQGVQVSCEASPHHLALTDEAVRRLDTNFKMNPPLRSEDDRRALIEGLRSGVIDCVATDHAPHAREEKEEVFETAPMGVTGLETAFAALVTDLVMPGHIPLATLVERMTAGLEPFGLLVPTIAKGAAANICLADLSATWEVGDPGYESRSINNAFAGRTLTGRVIVTVAGGAVAYRERSFAIGVAR
ncbi:MAG: dihydroorotase [Thermoleophilaceae bacterium]|jgi:dihydroorotase|nr:dihydroorotase [Thermoleophilaceae bacterium]